MKRQTGLMGSCQQTVLRELFNKQVQTCYYRSRARCVPLQTLSLASRGVKTAFSSKDLHHQRDIVAPTTLQERENWTLQRTTNQPPSSWNCQTSTRVPLPTGSIEFYEAKKPRKAGMECETYQDCGWFRRDSSSWSAAELFSPDSCEEPLGTRSDIGGVWDDLSPEAPSEGDYFINQGDDTYNINNYLIRKTDSFDNMKNISSIDPADVIPISYKERLHGVDIDLGLKVEMKEEMEDSELALGREEDVDVEEEEQSRQLAEALWADEPKKPEKPSLDLNLELSTALKVPVVNTPDFFMELVDFINDYDVTPPVAEITEPQALSTPVLSAPSLPSVSSAPSPSPPAEPLPAPSSSFPSIPTTVCEAAETKQKQTYLAIPRQLTRNEKLPKMVILKTESNLSTINLDHVKDATSIAERIKTVKRRRTTKYSVSEEESESDSDEDYEEESTVAAKRARVENVQGDYRYRELRAKNNEASRKSRQNRKDKERDLFRKLEDEEKRNVELRARADELEKLVNSHRQLLLQVVLRRGSGG